MSDALDDLVSHLLNRLREVQQRLGAPTAFADDPDVRFADLLDSMAMVEFLAVLAEDCGVRPEAVEASVDFRFGTIAQLAAGLHAAGLVPRKMTPISASESTQAMGMSRAEPLASAWLAATAVALPEATQPAVEIDRALQRPPGWLERHAGIQQRRVWADQDTIAVAGAAARACLKKAGVGIGDVGAVLVTSEAPPMLTGLAAAMHYQLQLHSNAVALEIGAACTGFVSSLWTAQSLLPRVRVVLIVSIEAPTRYLELKPGVAGENAALFGDAAAAAVLCDSPVGGAPLRLADVHLGVDGGVGGLLRVAHRLRGALELRMRGIALASRAVNIMARSVVDLARAHHLNVSDLAAVVVHGGNGRMLGLLARKLNLPPQRVWSETSTTGNLGSASLPVAWDLHAPTATGPVIWTAVGAGLTWGAALFLPETK